MPTPDDPFPLSDVYAAWTSSAPVCERNAAFYRRLYRESRGVRVELGVGDGRIAVDAARAGCSIVGVDHSADQLALCRARAESEGVADRLTLVHADMREFRLAEPASLVTIPFHTIGHLVSLDDKRAALGHIRDQLIPGGRLVFDHFVFDSELARSQEGVPHLRAELVHPDSGRDTLLWVTCHYDRDRQHQRIVAWTDEVDEAGVVVRRRYRRMDFSWIRPDQVRELLRETGFEIEKELGGFSGQELTSTSQEQIWFARRPG